MASQSRGLSPAAARVPTRPPRARRECYPDISPQSSLRVGPVSRDTIDFSAETEWHDAGFDFRYTFALDQEGGTP
jgi:hypothetical protein